MRLLMENWDSYINEVEESEKVFEDHAYITEILGIDLPLSESGEVILDESKKAEILYERMLHENFLKSAIEGVKESSGQIKQLLIAIYRIVKDSAAMQTFVQLISSKVLKPILNIFRKAINKMKTLGGKIEQLANKVSQLLEGFVQKVTSLGTGWKGALALGGVAVALKFAYGKVKGFLEDAINGKIEDELVAWLQEKAAELFGQQLVDKVMGTITDVKSYLGTIGAAWGGTAFVAATLYPATSRLTDKKEL